MSNGDFIEAPPSISDINDPVQGNIIATWLNNVWKFLKRRDSNVTGSYDFNAVASGDVSAITVQNGVITGVTTLP